MVAPSPPLRALTVQLPEKVWKTAEDRAMAKRDMWGNPGERCCAAVYRRAFQSVHEFFTLVPVPWVQGEIVTHKRLLGFADTTAFCNGEPYVGVADWSVRVRQFHGRSRPCFLLLVFLGEDYS